MVVEGNPSGPGRPGSFEVTLPDGAVLYSKLSNGGWPEADLVVDAIGSSAACGIQQQQ
jgi:selT/selW/selH-like putative selenoprotein